MIAVLFLTGCATQKTMLATGGSKADGTVQLAYDVGYYEDPVIDEAQALDAALKRCAAWGYKTAERFDAGMLECFGPKSFGRCDGRVTVTYQCMD